MDLNVRGKKSAIWKVTSEWLDFHTMLPSSGHGLNLYKVLAPNAYPQLDSHVQITDGRVLSQVYDVSHSTHACLEKVHTAASMV